MAKIGSEKLIKLYTPYTCMHVGNIVDMFDSKVLNHKQRLTLARFIQYAIIYPKYIQF